MKESKFISPYIKAKLFNHHNEKSLTILLSEIERLENRIMMLELKIENINFITNSIGPCSPDPSIEEFENLK